MAKPKKMMGVQQILLSPSKDTKVILEYVCSESNKLHNCAVYYARQVWFKSRRFVSGFELVNEMGKNRHFSALSSEAAVQTCLSVGESISSFARLLSQFNKGELEQKPRMPNYRRTGYQVVSFPNWTVRSSRKINEFTRVSAPNVLHPSSRLTIAERLSMQGF